MNRNADWFRALKILLSITNILIIPLTSTVCASVAVVYVQNFGRDRRLSMQHTSTLADKGWTSPLVWLALLTVKGWRSRGSQFLVFAMAFHALGMCPYLGVNFHVLMKFSIGFIIGPLQQYYVGQANFKFQSGSTPGLQRATDIPDLVWDGATHDNSMTVARLRNELASVTYNDFQSTLWQEGSPKCAANTSSNFNYTDQCYEGGTTLTNISSLLGPYLAQIPSGYSTGLLTQYMPRMNSSVFYANFTHEEFPKDCDLMPNAYYSHYIYNDTLLNVQVCMPEAGLGPWRATRDRQDITEQMFLDVNWGTLNNAATIDSNPPNATFKLVVNTTLGYFELPNYNNSRTAGALLAKDPLSTCHNSTHGCSKQQHSKRTVQVGESNSTYKLDSFANLGPLTLLTKALFEPGSFIATQFTQFLSQQAQDQRENVLYGISGGQPVAHVVAPLTLLARLGGPPQQSELFAQPKNANDGYSAVSEWLKTFYTIEAMQNALHAGIILSCQAWLGSGDGHLGIYYDLGLDSERVKISPAGVILISVLLAIDLALLIGLGIYVRFSYTWTVNYDPSAMMMLGAARVDELPLLINSSEGERETRGVLENMPGWIGDAAPQQDVGVLDVGAITPLRRGRKYRGL